MSPQDIAEKVGEQIGTSPWVEISQERINQFAEATGDHQFIHVKRPGQWQQTVEITIEIEGEEKPALICEWMTMFFV